MSVEVDVVYEGDLRCKAVHGPSGHAINTDAPADNNGKGELFSPTDLLSAAIGTCVLTVMGIVANLRKVDIRGTEVRVAKEMAPNPARRVAKMDITVTLPAGLKLSEADRENLERAANLCPVKRSLHPDVALNITYVYP